MEGMRQARSEAREIHWCWRNGTFWDLAESDPTDARFESDVEYRAIPPMPVAVRPSYMGQAGIAQVETENAGGVNCA